MARRLEYHYKEILLDIINSDFPNKSKKGKIHVIDSYCELKIRNENLLLSEEKQSQIKEGLNEIIFFSTIKNLEEYCLEYNKSSKKYLSTINKYLHELRWIKEKETILDKIYQSESWIIKVIIAVGSLVLFGITRKSGLILNTLLRENSELGLVLFGLLIIGLGIILIIFVPFNPFKFIFSRFISSKDTLSKKLKKHDDLIKYLPKKWFQNKEDIEFILINHMKGREFSAYSKIINFVPSKWFSEKDVVLLLLSMEHYSRDSYGKIINRLSKEILNDRPFFIQAVYRNWRVYEYLPEKFKNDEEVIWSFLKCQSSFYFGREKIPEFIFLKKENVKRLFNYEKDNWSKDKFYFDSSFLRGLPEEYKKDREFLKSIISLNGYNILDIDPSLKNDVELIEIAKFSRYPYPKGK